jgi:hypothetical protein
MFEEELAEQLGVPDDVSLVALLPVGFPQGRFGPVTRKPAEEVTHFDRWGHQNGPVPHRAGTSAPPSAPLPGVRTVTSTKGVLGHSLGAAGALEAIAILLAMQNRLIPPTDGTDELDPDLPTIDLVLDKPRSWLPGPSISNSFGFGGHNGTLVLGVGMLSRD